jgi:DNA-binding LytR/AlgR family response regulator
MKTLIIEDEPYAAKNLQRKLATLDFDVQVLAVIENVGDGIKWFHDNDPPELIISDIQLADGLCFDIFKKVNPQSPIIFTTAFDEYAIEAFKLHSIDYLMKPIHTEDLARSLQKLKAMKEQFSVPDYERLAQYLHKPEFKTRMTVYAGDSIIPVPVEEIAYFFTEEGETQMVTTGDKTYFVNDSLDHLEKQLNPLDFFRGNRQFIISIKAIKKVRQHFNRKLKVELKPGKNAEVMISKERASEFKHWLDS